MECTSPRLCSKPWTALTSDPLPAIPPATGVLVWRLQQTDSDGTQKVADSACQRWHGIEERGVSTFEPGVYPCSDSENSGESGTGGGSSS
jgi:hypothetical protein